jgi:hypothetical protein
MGAVGCAVLAGAVGGAVAGAVTHGLDVSAGRADGGSVMGWVTSVGGGALVGGLAGGAAAVLGAAAFGGAVAWSTGQGLKAVGQMAVGGAAKLFAGGAGAGGGSAGGAALGEGSAVSKLLYGARPGENLPGAKGIGVPARPSVTEMENLSAKHGVEFAVTYKYGAGSNGGGGQYFLHSGEVSSCRVPLEVDRMLVYHTHPGGTPWESTSDRAVMDYLKSIGSPQRTSWVIPVGRGVAIPFGGNG